MKFTDYAKALTGGHQNYMWGNNGTKHLTNTVKSLCLEYTYNSIKMGN